MAEVGSGIKDGRLRWEMECVQTVDYDEYAVCTFKPVDAEGNVLHEYGAFSICAYDKSFFKVGARYYLDMSEKSAV